MVNVGVGGSGSVVVITPVADGVSLQSLLGKMATKEMKEEPEFYSTRRILRRSAKTLPMLSLFPAEEIVSHQTWQAYRTEVARLRLTSIRKLPNDLRNGDNVLNRRLAFPKGNAIIQCKCSSGAVSKGGEGKSCSATTSTSVHREPPARRLYDPKLSIYLQPSLDGKSGFGCLILM
nr:hypothetical protein Iba_chr14aCG4970 [Ipomoea batatas]